MHTYIYVYKHTNIHMVNFGGNLLLIHLKSNAYEFDLIHSPTSVFKFQLIEWVKQPGRCRVWLLLCLSQLMCHYHATRLMSIHTRHVPIVICNRHFLLVNHHISIVFCHSSFLSRSLTLFILSSFS